MVVLVVYFNINNFINEAERRIRQFFGTSRPKYDLFDGIDWMQWKIDFVSYKASCKLLHIGYFVLISIYESIQGQEYRHFAF